MTTQTKSIILIVFTLLVGMSLGLFGDAVLARGRRDRVDRLLRRPALASRLERAIQPHSGAQADSLRTIIDRIVDGNDSIIRAANDRLRARMDSLHGAVLPLLDADQKTRFEQELRRVPPLGAPGGGRGEGPPPDGGPPPGGGPPP